MSPAAMSAPRPAPKVDKSRGMDFDHVIDRKHGQIGQKASVDARHGKAVMPILPAGDGSCMREKSTANNTSKGSRFWRVRTS
jgi:hypothetical protein